MINKFLTKLKIKMQFASLLMGSAANSWFSVVTHTDEDVMPLAFDRHWFYENMISDVNFDEDNYGDC